MRKIVLAVLMLAMSAAPALAQSTVALTWTPISTSALPICPATGTKLVCQTTDTISDVTVSSSPVVLTSTLAATASTFSTTMQAVNLYSTRLYTLTTAYFDASGQAQTTTAATCGSAGTPPPCAVAGIKVTAPAPTNFGGTVTTQ